MTVFENKQAFFDGVRDGLPIGMAYFAVAFSLGIAANNAGLTPFQGFAASALVAASAGEYAGFSMIRDGATYLQMAVMIFIANARYLLMSCALSQKFSEKESVFHRLFVGFYLTDELFGIAINRPGKLNPYYSYGAFSTSIPLWAVATALGIVTGSALSPGLVSAFSMSLFGMFMAIIIPTAKENRIVLYLICASFILSYAFSVLPVFSFISSGTRTIILTVGISAASAMMFPVKEENTNE
ncbi:MAG: AzlC family ABC transporter permease [Oscillospiraceae bacterium]|nr:AzlC family ABC transporter permease [Oscillospiraceae bacterium]